MLMHRRAGSPKLPGKIRKTRPRLYRVLTTTSSNSSSSLGIARAQVPTPECIYSAEFRLRRPLDLSRLREIESSSVQRKIEAVACSCFTDAVLCARCERASAKPQRRIPMHLHNCAYKFRTLPEGFARLTGEPSRNERSWKRSGGERLRVYTGVQLRFLVPRIPNSIRWIIYANTRRFKSGRNFPASSIAFAFRPSAPGTYAVSPVSNRLTREVFRLNFSCIFYHRPVAGIWLANSRLYVRGTSSVSRVLYIFDRDEYLTFSYLKK